ncbi:MAG: 5'-nucleotidase C-terminal domain-containing protein, partial [candidate division WOR-3 bacterium]|nr:5'-nucleotidase C-terminal domain-containing protein [candidate division WOR-3 bacterium]
VKQEKTKNPCLFIIHGKIFSEEPITTLYRGEAEIAILNAAEIDAIVLTPDFLRFGSQRAQALINQGDFFFLGANIYNRAKKRPLAQEYLIKNLDDTKISLLGLLVDSNDLYLRLQEIEYKDPIYTAKKLIPLLKMRSDLVGLSSAKSDTLALTDLNFVIGPLNPNSISAQACGSDENLRRLDLFLSDDNVIIDYQNSVVPLVDTISEDNLIKAAIQNFTTRHDSMLDTKITEIKKDLDLKNLTNLVNQAILTETKVDGVILQKQLVLKTIAKGSVTYRKLFEPLKFTQNLVIVTVSGKEIEELKAMKFEIVWSANLKKQRPVLSRNYRIATTPDLIADKTEWHNKETTLTDSTLIAMVTNYLKKGGK